MTKMHIRLCPACGSNLSPDVVRVLGSVSSGAYQSSEIKFDTLQFYRCLDCSVMFGDPYKFSADRVNSQAVLEAMAKRELDT